MVGILDLPLIVLPLAILWLALVGGFFYGLNWLFVREFERTE